ncbi:MAG TPA: SsrA-binding protein SmpB [Bdellovibrionales bacterium]|nr:SsrA-binding protein SmpB [Bdellovibrionales bacterium]
MTESKKKTEIKVVAENKKARFDYSIGETFEAGLELKGSEVKSLRAGEITLKDSYIAFKNGEAYLQNAHINVYKASSYMNHEPERLRRLLLKSTELAKIERAITEKGLTCVPLKVYFKGGWAKLEIALAKGKNAGDKRESMKSRDVSRELAQAKRRR